ncbi:MAG: hypothetical protein GW938_10145 [Leptospira sp.]|nr:hypothetical protein [Leptospira sp.]NCS93490.1 hypothetical protein [Leptospira sp.]
MDKSFSNHLTTIVIGAILGILTLIMSSMTPVTAVNQIHSGYSSTLIALELAQEPEDVYGIIGGPEDEEYMDYVDHFKSLILYDLVFIILYVIFYLQIITFIYRDQSTAWGFYLSSILVALSGVSDLGENFQLQAILEASSPEKMSEPLYLLGIFTHIKWGLIFLINAWIGIKLWLYERGTIHKAVAIAMFTSFMFYAACFLKPNLLELGILFLAISFILFWIYSLLIIVLSRKT